MLVRRVLLVAVCSVFAGAAHAQSWSGFVAPELRHFFHDGLSAQQANQSVSVSGEVEYNQPFAEGAGTFDFRAFARWDEQDDERSHGDLRELSWVLARERWEWRAGVRKVFWGVTESRHLVDIINQTDLVENPDGEDKLGQPMLNAAYISEVGIFDIFYMPYFRERPYPGESGRLRGPVVVDGDQAEYESHRGKYHPDFALRWSHVLGVWDVGLSHFYGTGREPRLIAGVDGSGAPVLVPRYELIHQTGLDIQATIDSWLWKLEYAHRVDPLEVFNAAVAGLEYTLFGIDGSAADLGLIMEYLYDDRKDEAPQPFENDVMLGARWVANDVQSTEILTGFFFDLDGDGYGFNLEASRRLGDYWKLSAELRTYTSDSPPDFLYYLRNDDYVQIELARYF